MYTVLVCIVYVCTLYWCVLCMYTVLVCIVYVLSIVYLYGKWFIVYYTILYSIIYCTVLYIVQDNILIASEASFLVSSMARIFYIYICIFQAVRRAVNVSTCI